MKQLSIVGRDPQIDQHVVGYYNTGDRMKYWGGLGAPFGVGYGDYCSVQRYFLFPGLAPWWSPDPSLCGS